MKLRLRESLDSGTGLGTHQAMEAEIEYTALVSVKVDLERGDVVSVGISATRDENEPTGDVSVSLESETEQPDELFDRAQQFDDAAAPFELSGWWAPSSTQRWTPVVVDFHRD